MQQTATSHVIAASGKGHAIEREDFNAVARLYWPRIFRFALASVRDRDAAENVAQDCFLKAYRGWPSFRGDSSVQTWLMQIAINLIRDHMRNQRLRFWHRTQRSAAEMGDASDWIPDGHLTPEASALVKERVEAVWSATGSLTERQRTVFLLRFVEDMDLLEIAAATGMREGTVKVHLSRAVHAVRERIGSAK
ncbi:MAG: RNA polymerase sigma factor [Bryobacteraceae bacterium]